MTDGEFDRSSLEPDFRAGLGALEAAVAERNPPTDEDVRLIGKHDTNVVVRLGIWPTDHIAAVDYEHPEYVLYVQIPERFPTGTGKGFVSSPPLERRDRSNLSNNPWQQSLAQVVEQETGQKAESYSHNWANTSMNVSEDMVKFLDVADEFLSRG